MFGILILAGGAGNRFGGMKALAKLGSKSMLSHVVEGVLGSADEVVVAIGRDHKPDEYRRVIPPGVTVTNDEVAGGGPLAGILAGMLALRSEYAAVLPCDSPFIKKEVLMFLFDRARRADAAIPRWPNGYIEPLHAVYRVPSALSAAREAIGKGRLTIRAMIARLGKVIYVSTDEIRKIDPELSTFFNINTQEEMRAAAKMLETRAI